MAINWERIFAIGDINHTWLPYIVISMIFCLAVYTMFLIVIKENSPHFTCNRLTMRPYYLTLVYTVVFTIQMLFAVLIENNTLYVLNMVNVTKFSLQNTAVAVQAYEWFALYKMI